MTPTPFMPSAPSRALTPPETDCAGLSAVAPPPFTLHEPEEVLITLAQAQAAISVLPEHLPAVQISHPLDEASDLEQALAVYAKMGEVAPSEESPAQGLMSGMVKTLPKLRSYALAAFIIHNPFCSYENAAKEFGVSVAIVASIIRSDMFKEMLRNHVDHPIFAAADEQLTNELTLGILTAVRTVNAEVLKSNDPNFAMSAVKNLGRLTDRGTKSPFVQINNNIATGDMLRAAVVSLQAKKEPLTLEATA